MLGTGELASLAGSAVSQHSMAAQENSNQKGILGIVKCHCPHIYIVYDVQYH